jgi:non-ribosomal peptide synthetase component F
MSPEQSKCLHHVWFRQAASRVPCVSPEGLPESITSKDFTTAAAAAVQIILHNHPTDAAATNTSISLPDVTALSEHDLAYIMFTSKDCTTAAAAAAAAAHHSVQRSDRCSSHRRRHQPARSNSAVR